MGKEYCAIIWPYESDRIDLYPTELRYDGFGAPPFALTDAELVRFESAKAEWEAVCAMVKERIKQTEKAHKGRVEKARAIMRGEE